MKRFVVVAAILLSFVASPNDVEARTRKVWDPVSQQYVDVQVPPSKEDIYTDSATDSVDTSPQTQPTNHAMRFEPYSGPVWEYRVETIGGLSRPGGIISGVIFGTAELININGIGEEGWELVSVWDGVAFFKRQRIPLISQSSPSINPTPAAKQRQR